MYIVHELNIRFNKNLIFNKKMYYFLDMLKCSKIISLKEKIVLNENETSFAIFGNIPS